MWTQTSFGVPDWWAKTLPGLIENGRVNTAPDYAGGTYWDKGMEKLMRDPAADIKGILQEAEDTCRKEWLDEYTKKIKTG